MESDLNKLLIGPDRNGRWVAIADGHIAAVGTLPEAPPECAAQVRCADAVIEPGRVNAHTHLYSGLFALGLPPPTPAPETFLQILERLWWKLDRALDAASLGAAARYYVAEALLAGTTALVDHHESPALVEGSLDILADACEELGMRALCCYGATERNGGLEEAGRGLDECRRFARERDSDRVKGLVGLHASFTVSDATLRRAGDLCRELGTVLHVHMAEAAEDVEDARQRGYAGPLERLDQLGALVPGSILAHGVHLDAAAMRLARERGCWIVQNPRSNLGNKVGYPAYLPDHPNVALGTDGYPAEMLEERRVLAEQLAAHGEPAAEAARRFDGGRRLLSARFGAGFGLSSGAVADLVVTAGGVTSLVVVAGRIVVREGRLLVADHGAIVAEAREQVARLGARMQAIG